MAQTESQAQTGTQALRQRIASPNFLSGRRSYYIAYTVCFAVVAIASFAGLYAYGNCLIWVDDGTDQHFTFFCYFGTWMREAISTGTLPQWDFSLGYGADVICSLASWIGDPFNWLSVPCPEQYSEYLYQAVVVLRLYLVGFAFSAYCRYHKRDGFGTLLGALAYAFCGYCLMKGAFRHAMFINPAIFLPWVLLGADKILDGKSPTTFIVALAVTFISYFYFAYMIIIFVVLYCLLRYFVGGKGTDANGKRSVRSLLLLVGRFLLYGVVGALVAGIALAPIVAYVLQMDRISVEHNFPIARSVTAYLNFPLSYAGGTSWERGLSMEALAVFGVAMVLFTSCCRRKNDDATDSADLDSAFLAMRQTRIVLVIMIVFVLVPFFGRMFNGFSYQTDRWMFALAMSSAYALTLAVPFIRDMSKRDWRNVGIAFIFLAADGVLLLVTQYDKNVVWVCIALACLALTYFGIFLASKRGGVATVRVVLAALMFVNIAQFVNAGLFTHEDADDDKTLADYLMPVGTVLSTEKDNAATRMLESSTADDQPYRFDKATELHNRNSVVMQDKDHYSIDFYASIYSQVVDNFRSELGIPQNTAMQSHHIFTSNSRAAIEAVSSVKYFAKVKDDKSVKPYGFDTLVATEDKGKTTYELWRTDNALPFAFTYDKAVSPDAFKSADPMWRQQALLQGCTVEGSSLPDATVEETAVEIPFKVNEEESGGVSLADDGSIVVTDTTGKLVLEFEGKDNSETYLYLRNMSMTKYLPNGKTAAMLKNGDGELSFADRVRLLLREYGADTPDYRIDIKNGKMNTRTRYATTYAKYYTGRNTWLINAGYTEKACNKLVLTFDETGTISMDEMKVYCQPMDGFAEQVAARAADPTHVQLGTNTVNGTVNAPDTRLVYLSVPYSQGWSATVDGQPVKVMQANTGFMAIEVGAGQHEFQFTYETPFLKAGLAMTLAGLVLLVLLDVFHRRRLRSANAQ